MTTTNPRQALIDALTAERYARWEPPQRPTTTPSLTRVLRALKKEIAA